VPFDSFFTDFPPFSSFTVNFCGERHDFVAFAALSSKSWRSPQKLTVNDEKGGKSVKNCQMAPKSGKFRRKMFLNNPTSSKISFYLILVNID